MAVRAVLVYPHPALKAVAARAEPGSRAARELTADLLDTMRAAPACVGLAATQIGALTRIVAVDVSQHKKAPPSHHGLLVLANPVVVLAAGGEVAREGCLSLPELTANVRRATEIVVEAGDPLTGADRVIRAEGFEARALLHEIDHLDGLLFLDRVESLSRDVFRRARRSAPPGGSAG